jgi:uncharacterized membrane protein YfbV (UPF0208 family)
MSSLSLVEQYFEGHRVLIRPEDEYWNLTAMCKIYNKRINNFLRIDSTESYMKALAYRLNKSFIENSATDFIFYFVPPSPVAPKSVTELIENSSVFKPLVEVYQGGVPELQGTWGHRRVALRLATWLNPDLEVWVYEVIEKLFVEGKVELQNEVSHLREALGEKEKQLDEWSIEIALLEHQANQGRYFQEEAFRLRNWRAANSWHGDVD